MQSAAVGPHPVPNTVDVNECTYCTLQTIANLGIPKKDLTKPHSQILSKYLQSLK
jgi:hypothetical protein